MDSTFSARNAPTVYDVNHPLPLHSLATRIDALPSSWGLWRFIILLSLGGFFELYDLFQTADRKSVV